MSVIWALAIPLLSGILLMKMEVAMDVPNSFAWFIGVIGGAIAGIIIVGKDG